MSQIERNERTNGIDVIIGPGFETWVLIEQITQVLSPIFLSEKLE